MKMRINYYDGRSEIREVDEKEESLSHVFKIYRERLEVGLSVEMDFHVEFLYDDGWVNGNVHNSRIKKYK